MRKDKTKRLPRQKGLAAVEFALTILLVMVVIFWAFEFIMLVYTYNVMAEAAKEGVRYAIVHGANNSSSSGPATGAARDCTTNIAAITTLVQSYASTSFHNIAGMTITVCYLDGNNQPPNRVQVVVSYPFIPYASLGWIPPIINAAAEGRIAN
jgi:Flp pilus assembly protein TadG